MTSLSILGMGSAYPNNIIDNHHLGGGQYSAGCVPSAAGLRTRRTVLDPQYIADTGNADSFELRSVPHGQPSQLAKVATLQALERAGVSPEQVELFLGETATPEEVTPSEAQRVAGLLDLRVPAYDLACGVVSFAAQIEFLLARKPEATPRLTVLVSANAPTRFIDYKNSAHGYLFGDGAAAVVVGSEQSGNQLQGKIAIKAAATFMDPSASSEGDLIINTHQHLAMPAVAVDLLHNRVNQVATLAIKNLALNPQRLHLVPSVFDLGAGRSIAHALKIPEQQLWSDLNCNGYSLGSGPLAVLSQRWDSVASGTGILFALAGSGGASGYVYCEAV